MHISSTAPAIPAQQSSPGKIHREMMTALHPKADIDELGRHARFVPIADILFIQSPRPQLRAGSVEMQAQVLWRF